MIYREKDVIYEDCKILGLMALYRFELAKECLDALIELCDYVCVRFQIANNPPCDWSLLEYAMNHNKVLKVLVSKQKYNKWNWREDLVGLSDTIMPELILFCDEDEKFGDDIVDDLDELRKNPNAKYLRFNFEMMHDKNDAMFPTSPHVKAFKWQPKITYLPYPGWARTASYLGIPGASMNAKSKIKHYYKCGAPKIVHTGTGYD